MLIRRPGVYSPAFSTNYFGARENTERDRGRDRSRSTSPSAHVTQSRYIGLDCHITGYRTKTTAFGLPALLD